MSPSTLKELVNLWREVNTTPFPPSVFISQKLEPYQNDKIDIWHTHKNPTDFLPRDLQYRGVRVLYKHRYGWVLYKYRYLSEEERRSDRYVTRHLYTYQKANPENERLRETWEGTEGDEDRCMTIYRVKGDSGRGAENICDFQIKPPVKSLFTGIPGPYKII